MKLLLYCTKSYCTESKLYLYKRFEWELEEWNFSHKDKIDEFYLSDYIEPNDELNGKIVAECDFEIEEIRNTKHSGKTWYYLTEYPNNPYMKRTCLTEKQLDDYLKGNIGYAIHIKNLHIFDEPKELFGNAPQNMCYCSDIFKNRNILISIQPKWLCKILNGEKTIEVRKKVLKEMLNDK